MTRPFSPAADRNKHPILRVLGTLLTERARVLEIGAGTGQHAEFFTHKRPDLEWLATDVGSRLADLEEVAEATGSPPRFRVQSLELGQDDWPGGPFDAVFTANTLHIMPWPNTARLIEGASRALSSDGLLLCYGPFKDQGRHNADSNFEFDQSLRARDPEMGIRDLVELRRLGEQFALPVRSEISLPANNRLIVFKKC